MNKYEQRIVDHMGMARAVAKKLYQRAGSRARDVGLDECESAAYEALMEGSREWESAGGGKDDSQFMPWVRAKIASKIRNRITRESSRLSRTESLDAMPADRKDTLVARSSEWEAQQRIEEIVEDLGGKAGAVARLLSEGHTHEEARKIAKMTRYRFQLALKKIALRLGVRA